MTTEQRTNAAKLHTDAKAILATRPMTGVELEAYNTAVNALLCPADPEATAALEEATVALLEANQAEAVAEQVLRRKMHDVRDDAPWATFAPELEARNEARKVAFNAARAFHATKR